MSVSR
ncbi:hypothetical protein D048_1162A, partial [Vibrio parahaemolyticus VPTS-2009]